MPKPLGKKPPRPAQCSATPPEDSDDEPKTFVKTPEQVSYLDSHLSGYFAHQNARTLDRFWPRVYDGWYKQWPITASPKEIRNHGSSANAILVIRNIRNKVRIPSSLYRTLSTTHFLTDDAHVLPQPGSPQFQVLKI